MWKNAKNDTIFFIQREDLLQISNFYQRWKIVPGFIFHLQRRKTYVLFRLTSRFMPSINKLNWCLCLILTKRKSFRTLSSVQANKSNNNTNEPRNIFLLENRPSAKSYTICIIYDKLKQSNAKQRKAKENKTNTNGIVCVCVVHF